MGKIKSINTGNGNTASGGAFFSTKVGLIAATVGSAVGLGNIWRFPAEAQANGGAAFLLIYIACVFLLGIPVMVAEAALGRAGRSDAVGSYLALTGNSNNGAKSAGGKSKSKWWIGGALAILAAYIILSFYMVVAGWTFEYLWQSVTGGLYSGTTGATLAGMDSAFHTKMEEFVCSDWSPLVNTFVMIGINIAILVMGVQKGIERMSNIMMPVLFLLLLVFCGYALTMPGAAAGVEYFFKPDFSKITWGVAGNALGQAFFSLSLGMGILVTYASYYPSDTKLVPTAVTVSVLDLLVAVMMGIIIFPAVMTFNLDMNSLRGTTLVFVTLPEVFAQLPGTQIWSILFFLLLMVAALTSTISIAEVSVKFVQDKFKKSRWVSVLIVMLPLFIFSSVNSLSFGSLSDIKIFGMTIFNFLDMFSTNILLPIVSLFVVLFMGWFAPKGVMHGQVTNNGTVSARLYPTIKFIIRYLAPILILLILISTFL